MSNKNNKASKAEPVAELVAVSKSGQTIRVCPAQVEQHKRLGWNVVEK